MRFALCRRHNYSLKMKQPRQLSFFAIGAIICFTVRVGAQTTLTVSAQANIFGAGHLAPLDTPNPSGGSGGIPPVVFAFPAHRILDAGIVGGAHVRFRAAAGDGARLDGIAFRAAETPLGRMLLEGRGESLHLAGQLALDHYGGRERVQFRLIDAARPGQRR